MLQLVVICYTLIISFSLIFLIHNSGYILQLCRRQNLITFTEEIFNGKLQFLCIVIASVTLEDYRTSQV